ncbi:MarR family transcriptional regulator [Massilia sp. W12]|uniref:MarR family winged helix-turn-helix transcriptional regulator n=1 Tax=Massilia sp. W12 TaxID=3126507 RepID=UPI0030CB1AD7
MSANQAQSQVSSSAMRNLRSIMRANAAWSAWVEKRCGVTGAQLNVLQELQQEPGMRVGDLAQKLAIHQSTASNLIDGLEKRGLINKMREESDQRVVRLQLSESAQTLLQNSPLQARGLLSQALLQMDDDSLEQLNNGLVSLMSAMESLSKLLG